MNANQNIARNVGVLFIIGTMAGILSLVLTVSIFNGPDYLVKINENESQVIAGALLVLVMGFTLAMIPVLLFPILKEHNYTLALGAIVFRGALETVGYIAITISWLLLLTLSHEYANTTASALDTSHLQALATLLLKAVDRISQVSAFAFSVGALMIYTVFYQSKLIPRWLSVWGIIGAIFYLSVPLLTMFGLVWEVLYVPLAMQEMVLAVWLIVKGFDFSSLANY